METASCSSLSLIWPPPSVPAAKQDSKQVYNAGYPVGKAEVWPSSKGDKAEISDTVPK